MQTCHTVCIGVSTPLINAPPSFLPSPTPTPLKSATVQAPLFREFPFLLVFRDPLSPPPAFSENWIFQWTPQKLKLFILNLFLSFKSN